MPFESSGDEAVNMTIAKQEKNYILREDSTTPTSKYIFPLCSYEQDIADRKITSYINSDENFNQDIKCYVDQLCETPEFRLLFDHILCVKKIPSIASIYSYLNFYPSLGNVENERNKEDDDIPIRLDGLFNDTKSELRKLFVSNYKRKDFDPPNEEDQEGGFLQDLTRDLLSKTVDKFFMAPDVPWWMKWKLKKKKVDEDGEPCGNQFGGLVNLGE